MAFDTTIVKSATTSIRGAAFADGASLSGTWTANYNSTGGLVSVTNATFTVSGPGGTNTFTSMGTLPYAQDPTSPGFTSYEIHNLNSSGSGQYNALYVDWRSQSPSSFYEGTPSLFTSIKNSAVSTTPIRLVSDGTSGNGSTPTITGLPTTQSATDATSVSPFNRVSVTDADTSTSATITLSNGGIATDADGTLSGAGLTKTATGTYSLAFTTPANLTTELNALQFTPTKNQVAAGNTVVTGLILSVNDSDGSASANSNLTVTAACFLRGTRIATPDGDVEVERLKIGDRICVQSGESAPVKWIGRHAYGQRFIYGNRNMLPIVICADALSPGVPRRDLYVSPKHAMFIDGVFIHADELQNGRSIRQVTDPEVVEYFHVELDQHNVILAEGAPTESYIDLNNRHKFQNVAEFFALYPDTLAETRTFCAPLVEDGPLLEAARMRIAVRAGLAEPLSIGELIGHIDNLSDTIVDGWAVDNQHRDRPVQLEVLNHDELVASTVADVFRPDLADAGICSGRAGFRVKLPPTLRQPHAIMIRRIVDGAVLGPHHSESSLQQSSVSAV